MTYDVEKDKATIKSKNPLDKRFERIFTDKDFQIEEGDANFKFRNPSKNSSSKKRI